MIAEGDRELATAKCGHGLEPGHCRLATVVEEGIDVRGRRWTHWARVKHPGRKPEMMQALSKQEVVVVSQIGKDVVS